MWTIRVLIFGGLLSVGCTKSVNTCKASDDCKDIAYPFCDVLGVYPASGGDKGVCTVRPPDCPAEQCGCTPGSTCVDDMLTTCAADGKSTTTAMCGLGCGAPSDHCASFVPSFGVGVVLPKADAVGGVSITAGSTISTDTGVILDKTGNAIAMPSLLVPQLHGPDIRVFYARSLSIDDCQVRGTKPISFVTTGPLIVRGQLDLGGRTTNAGPGGLETGETVGLYRLLGTSLFLGGGGNGTDGASSLTGASSAAGKAYSGILLVGGGRGGDATHGGGGGGGAVHLASLDSVSIIGSVRSSGGGGKGSPGGAGGAGGTVVLEAPSVGISGVVTTNGGAGSECGEDAPDGPPDASAAAEEGCDVNTGATGIQHIDGGHGGTGTSLPTEGVALYGFSSSGGTASGGAVGRVVIRNRDGVFAVPAGVVVSAVISAGMLEIK